MPDTPSEEDLRATSDSIVSDAERLTSLELRKQRLAADDPELVALSTEIEALTERLRRKARAEREIAEELQAGT